MIGAIDFLNHWKEICEAEMNCKGCPLEHSCDCETLPSDFSSKRILALIRDVEKTRRKKKLGGYPEDGEA